MTPEMLVVAGIPGGSMDLNHRFDHFGPETSAHDTIANAASMAPAADRFMVGVARLERLRAIAMMALTL
jgi:hypothetical protein